MARLHKLIGIFCAGGMNHRCTLPVLYNSFMPCDVKAPWSLANLHIKQTEKVLLPDITQIRRWQNKDLPA